MEILRMASHKGSTLRFAGKHLCAALVACSLLAAASPARAEEQATRFWGQNDNAVLFRKVFFYGFGAAALVTAGIGLGFQEDAISKENARRDFVRQHGNTLYFPPCRAAWSRLARNAKASTSATSTRRSRTAATTRTT
jgi:hypothetical protein